MEKGSTPLNEDSNPFFSWRCPMRAMKAIVVKEIGSFEVESINLREIEDHEVLILVQVTGLCRTDLKIVEEGHRDLILPRIPGEEVVGTILEKGEGVSGFEAGQRVYVYPGIWCGSCPACRMGAENLCTHMEIMGFHRHGGFAQVVIAPAQSLIPVSSEIALEEAVFAEPLSCCLNALEQAGEMEGKRVAIWGAGPAGTLLFRAVLAGGGLPCCIEPDPWRRGLIDGVWPVPERFFDVCLVAVGKEEAYQEALAHLAPRGTLVVFSGLSPAKEHQPLSLNQIHYGEHKVVGAYGCCYRHGVEALDQITRRTIAVGDLVSHRLSLWELEKGLKIVKQRQGMKVLLYP
ncbi:MAG: alcohol dehydrogenase [Desulfobacca sp.]|nr:alcohol dehydrogenase [Desulfobacca sp.]